jgi:stearoyl-CoA desaturase (delta-9 desaturase)
MGESLHNNHHAFPFSAKFGLRWWQFDPGAWLIGALSKIGLAWKVRTPGQQMMRAKQLRS